jgi:hypothetical protein
MAFLFKIADRYTFVMEMSKEQLLEILIEKEKLGIAHTNRAIEKIEKERAFLLSKRKAYEDRISELRLCLKD